MHTSSRAHHAACREDVADERLSPAAAALGRKRPASTRPWQAAGGVPRAILRGVGVPVARLGRAEGDRHHRLLGLSEADRKAAESKGRTTGDHPRARTCQAIVLPTDLRIARAASTGLPARVDRLWDVARRACRTTGLVGACPERGLPEGGRVEARPDQGRSPRRQEPPGELAVPTVRLPCARRTAAGLGRPRPILP